MSSTITASVSPSGVTATVASSGSTSTVASGGVSASAASSQVAASVSGGIGPQGPAGAAGDVTVPAGLSNLSDVAIASLADGDVLRYSSSKWRNFREELLVDGGNFLVLIGMCLLT